MLCWGGLGSGGRHARRAGRSTLAALAAVLVVLAPVAGSADEPARAEAQPDKGPLLITLGSNLVWAPRFEGSRRHDVGPWPIISWRNQGDREWLDLPTDGLDFALIETDNFRAGPVGYWRWQRDNGTIAPRGFARIGGARSSIDLSLEGGGFLEYWPSEWLRTRLELRESFFGASGLLGILATDVVWRPDKTWTFSAGPRLTLADRRFMESYYGINAAQSLMSGLPVFSPQAGMRSYGANAFVRAKLSESWTAQAFVDYQHLTGSAGDSPVITSRGTPEQYMVGVGISYTFKAPW